MAARVQGHAARNRPTVTRPDLSLDEFAEACRALGFTARPLGYYDLGIPGHRAEVCGYNLMDSRRKLLEFLKREKARLEKHYARHATR